MGLFPFELKKHAAAGIGTPGGGAGRILYISSFFLQSATDIAGTRQPVALTYRGGFVASAQTLVVAAPGRREPIGHLPKMRRAGRTDVSDLRVTVNDLTPVSEPLNAVA